MDSVKKNIFCNSVCFVLVFWKLLVTFRCSHLLSIDSEKVCDRLLVLYWLHWHLDFVSCWITVGDIRATVIYIWTAGNRQAECSRGHVQYSNSITFKLHIKHNCNPNTWGIILSVSPQQGPKNFTTLNSALFNHPLCNYTHAYTQTQRLEQMII